MRSLRADDSIATYLWDLVYLSAFLQAAGRAELAGRVQDRARELKLSRGRYERAEELTVTATAFLSARDLTLDADVMALGRFVRAHHPELVESLLDKAPAEVVKQAYRDELRAVRTLVEQLKALPSDDPVRREFVPRLSAHADAEEAALAQKDEVLAQFAVVRVELDRFKAGVNVLRTEIYGALVTAHGDKKLADRYFRPYSGGSDDEPAPTPAPTPG